jgi:MYXO-CTERM domain-containing protein
MRFKAPQRRALLARLGLSIALLSSLGGSGCGPLGDGDPGGTAAGDGATRGELAVYISDDLEGRSETTYALRTGNGVERPLLFDTPPTFAPGTAIRVWGIDTPVGLRVTRAETLATEIESAASALRTAPAFPPRSFAFVLIDMGAGVNTTSADAMGRLITGPDSIRNYYLADSYGTQDVTAQVFGPIKYTLANGCGTGQLATDLRGMIPGTFQHYLWYFGSRQAACMWTGLASVGTPDRPSRDTWYNASTSCVVLVQEPGHNFGMQHSSSLTCPNAALADDPNTCTASEYGDLYDPMGSGCRHMNVWQKDYQGWFGGCNGVTVQSSGTFTILPIEQACDGVQFLKIVSPKVRMFNRPAAGGGGATVETFSHYYVELRTPQDFDGMLGNKTALAPQVLLHVGGDARGRTQRGLHTFLLDTTPATTGRAGFSDAALGVGKSFSDPAGGLTITVQAVSATQATINVDMPGGTMGPTCTDGSAFTAPGPGPESCTATITGAAGAAATGAGGAGGAGAGAASASGAAGGGTGAGGAAGATGVAGAPASTGAAGEPATGAAGSGNGPTSGAAGAGGAPSVTGTAGDVGAAAGTSGAPPTTGSGGATTLPHEVPGDVIGHGCGCRTAPTPAGSLGSLAGLAAVAAAVSARRSRPRRPRR